MRSTYNVGDVVRLKSGGVNMVVGDVKGTFATCQWHDLNGSYNAATFPQQTLMPGDSSIENHRDQDMLGSSHIANIAAK